MSFKPEELLDLNHTIAGPLFQKAGYVWEALPNIKEFLIHLTTVLPDDFERVAEYIWVGKGTTIENTALIKGPAIIGYDCEIRHAAFLRENVIIGNNVTIGNSTEVKNAVLFDNVQVPHFNYVGDSVMGYKSHLGAGVILSNVKSNGEPVKVKEHNGTFIDTGLKKFGAIIGDYVEVGCNAVLNPGTIIGRESVIYPLTSVRGAIPAKTIVKNNGTHVSKR